MRVDILNDITAVADGQNERYILWLKGWVGTGRSTFTHAITPGNINRNVWKQISSFPEAWRC
jgi:adenylylsulfate kinase-like enzyme